MGLAADCMQPLVTDDVDDEEEEDDGMIKLKKMYIF